MRTIATDIANKAAIPSKLDTSDKISFTMRAVKALEQGNWNTVRSCTRAFKQLADTLWYDESCWGSARSTSTTKDLAVSIAREEIQEDIRSMENISKGKVSRHKDNILRKLNLLIPGVAAGIKAVRNPDAEANTIVMEPSEMANQLADHWEGVFKRRDIDQPLLQR